MIVGLEYLGDAYASGIKPASLRGISTSAKTADVRWQDIEAFPGLARPSYFWTSLDASVNEWRAAGFVDLTIVLRCQHWACTSPTWAAPLPALASAPPKTEQLWTAWARFCCALATRYRGRVQAWEIESEADRLWAGTVDEYLRLLRLAYGAIRSGDPSARVVLAGISLGSLVDDDPSGQVLNDRLDALPEPQRALAMRAQDFYARTLASPDYHVAEMHSLHAPSGIGPTVRWMREMAVRPIECWVGDSFPAASVCWSAPGWNQHPKPEMDLRLYKLEIGDATAKAALLAEQVTTTKARIDEARKAGAARLYVGPLLDWPMVSGQPWQGIIEADGKPRPVVGVIRAAQ